MSRLITFIYGMTAYVIFLVTFTVFHRFRWELTGAKIHRFWRARVNRNFRHDQSGAALHLCASAQHHGTYRL